MSPVIQNMLGPVNTVYTPLGCNASNTFLLEPVFGAFGVFEAHHPPPPTKLTWKHIGAAS